jgi:hypothetical protein
VRISVSLFEKGGHMASATSKASRPPREEQTRNLLALARDPRFQAAVSSLVETPEEWEGALTDPAGWLRARGLELPQDLAVRLTKDLSISKPLGPEIAGKPDPDWIPFAIREINCRTFWLPKRNDQGKIVGYEEVRICFGFEIAPTPIPGGPLG